MKIPDEMQCHCRNKLISPAEIELARRFHLDPEDVHRFMDEWSEAAGHVARKRRDHGEDEKEELLRKKNAAY